MYVTQRPIIFALTYNPLFIGMFWKNAPKVPKERYFWVCTDLTTCP